MIESIVKAVFCHLFGDYVLQIDYIASTKAKNLYHMIVHCILYCVPFAFVFGIDYRLALIFACHFIVDELKAHGLISYIIDQSSHYLTILGYISLG